MIGFQHSTTNTKLYILLSIASIYSITVPTAAGYVVDFYSKDESPVGISYDNWVAKYWNWDASIPLDPETNGFAGLNENGCLVHKENSMAMLVDTAAGGFGIRTAQYPAMREF
jgi:hypothetical protein